MKSNDIPVVEDRIEELIEAHRRVKREAQNLGESMQRLVDECRDEPELLRTITRDQRYFQHLEAVIEDFPVARRVQRRLPIVEARLRRQERERSEGNRQTVRQAQEVVSSLEDILKRFLS